MGIFNRNDKNNEKDEYNEILEIPIRMWLISLLIITVFMFVIYLIVPQSKKEIVVYKKNNEKYTFNCVMELNYKTPEYFNNMFFIDKNKTKLIGKKECYTGEQDLYLDINYNFVKVDINEELTKKIKENKELVTIFINNNKGYENYECSNLVTPSGDRIYRFNDLIISKDKGELLKGMIIKSKKENSITELNYCLMVDSKKEIEMGGIKEKVVIYKPL